MVSVEERMKVLNLLQNGSISPEQAAQLLQAMETNQPASAVNDSAAFVTPSEPPAPASESTAPDQPAAPYTMPLVDPKPAVVVPAVSTPPPAASGRSARWLHVRVSDMSTGHPRVNVRLPLSLVGFGLKIGRHYAPEMDGIDVEELTRVLQNGEPGPFVDVYDEDDGEHVEVFLE